MEGDSAIHTPADLKGKRIIVNRGGGPHLFILALLQRHGMAVSDVNLVFLGPTDAKPAFAKGDVDAWLAWPHYTTLAIEQDGGRASANLDDVKGLCTGNDYHIAHVDAIRDKRELVHDFRRRLVAAQRWALANVDAAAAIISRDTRLPLHLARSIRETIRPTPGNLSDDVVASLREAAAIYHRHGLIGATQTDGGFDRSFAV